MKTRHYKTLKGFMRATGTRQFTLSDFRSERIYHSGLHQWIKFQLSEDAKNEFVKGITSVLWSKVNDERMFRVEHARDMGILRRLWYDGRRFTYCAGQDYTSEIRFIQRSI